MFRKFMEEVEKAGNVKTVCRAVEKLLDETDRAVSKRDLTFEGAQDLAIFITRSRKILSDLSRSEGECAENEKAATALQALKTRSLDLEGVVKEVRNDLYREKNFKPL